MALEEGRRSGQGAQPRENDAWGYREVTPCGVTFAVPAGETLCRVNTRFGQEFRIFTAGELGWVMTLNGQLQNSELDCAFYHELMAHVPMVSHGQARRVLVAGGASGALVGELLKHPVSEIDVVEIDEELRRACASALPVLARNFQSPRVNSIFQDIMQFLSEGSSKYDVVFLDLPDFDQEGPVGALSFDRLYSLLSARLAPGGLAVVQSSVPFLGNQSITKDVVSLARRATYSGLFATPSPLFPGGFQTFTWFSGDFDLSSIPFDEIERRTRELKGQTECYDAAVHAGSLAFGAMMVRRMGL